MLLSVVLGLVIGLGCGFYGISKEWSLEKTLVVSIMISAGVSILRISLGV